ncbi:MAG: prolyl oligopeptidase family serine peptidase [Planctomycetota bacterium]|nr:prolyl oligopeptidase family serine peptidase [Planctomycetota bacterium]MDA1252176.1 prolyl oligopeptidase family serine peptidase [Planctomycetota bacterium]
MERSKWKATGKVNDHIHRAIIVLRRVTLAKLTAGFSTGGESSYWILRAGSGIFEKERRVRQNLAINSWSSNSMKHAITATALILCGICAAQLSADDTPDKLFPGTRSEWKGFDQFDFTLDEVECRVVTPKEIAKGRPWIWRARFWGHEPQTDIALLKKGFHVAYCDVANLWGNEEAIRRWDRFYKFLTTEHGFSRRPALEGMSRGGLIIYHWAIKHPTQISCIYGDAPALGIRPYVRDLSPGDPGLDRLKDWMAAHDLTLEAAKKYKLDALDRLAPLAEAKVRIIHVCGDADESVPFEEHTADLARRYRKLGGTIQVIVKQGGKHHPHSLKDPTPIVEFIVESQSQPAVDRSTDQ